jgi:alpha-ketoglutaric semialdehyde dehydrogenase
MASPSQIHGQQLLGPDCSAGGPANVTATNPSTGETLAPAFHEATPDEIDRALQLADEAGDQLRDKSPEEIAAFLDAIGDEIMGLGDALLDRCHAETGLPMGRLQMERGRTVNQAKLFATLVREGSWVDARVDHGDPTREPMPKPDVRRMLMPVGPVVVFGASNFPLALSTAGSDTVSAIAAGCSVVMKAHGAHPGTSELIGRAIIAAAEKTNMPKGVFSLLHGGGRTVGTALVKHPLTQAVGFTGSLSGGRALHDVAASRPDPIPVYAEMGSINPVFLLPSALASRGATIAEGFLTSMTLGVGQFCTQPGLVVGLASDPLEAFVAKTSELVTAHPAQTMLNAGIRDTYDAGCQQHANTSGVATAARSEQATEATKTEAAAILFRTDGASFLQAKSLSEEIFGPTSMVVACDSREQLEQIARGLVGHLTATIHGEPDDLVEHQRLVRILERKVGRLIFNGFPTGIEVCAAMHHGGPYPATTDAASTSIGTAAILRFARPICYQGFPENALPPALQDTNPAKLWRLVDNKTTNS